MAAGDLTQDLLSSVEDALALLRGTPGLDARLEVAEPLPSLLDQCAALARGTRPAEPLRSLHHMACTGGTLISRCLALMPNTTVLSEIDPLSRIGLPARGKTPPFRPHDLIFALHVALRPVEASVIERVFVAGLAELLAAHREEGRYLCLRDHAHSQYCTDQDWRQRPTLYALMRRVADVRSVVTVRHPVDSFVSLTQNKWVHFSPATIEEYAIRYLGFLDDHRDMEIVRYEDFVRDPEAQLARICGVLGLPYRPGFEDLLMVSAMSGDSGRSGQRIAPRPRREIPADIRAAIPQSRALAALCDRLGYETP